MGEGEKGVRRALTYDDRLAIERGLNRGDRVSRIARSIGRAPKVVAGVVKRNWTDDPRGMLVVRTRSICPGRPCCVSQDLFLGFHKNFFSGFTKFVV